MGEMTDEYRGQLRKIRGARYDRERDYYPGKRRRKKKEEKEK